MIGDFVSGSRYFMRGLRIIRQGGLRRFVIMPVIINILVFGTAVLIGIDQFDNLLNWILPGGESWWAEFARIALWVFFAVAVFVVLFFTFTLLANLLGAPFNGLLSEIVERSLIGEEKGKPGGIPEFLSTILPSLIGELRKLVYFIGLAVLVFILTLIPIVNLLSPFLWALFTSWMLAVEYIAYPMENNKRYFSQVKNLLRQNRAMALGFGMTAMVMNLVPLLNFLVMPAAVAGATALWVERLRRLDRDGGTGNRDESYSR